MSNIVEEITRRTYRYYYEDGLVEIAVGAMFLFLGLALLLFEWVLLDSSWGWLMGIALPVLTLSAVFGVKRLIVSLKARVTYPRTGAVTYRDQPGSGRWLLLAAVFLLVVAGFFFPEDTVTTAFMAGGLLAVILLYMGGRVSLARMQAAAIVPIAAGVFSGFTRMGDIPGTALVFGLTGAELLLFGAVALVRYLRENPEIELEDR